jgi:hypothetical protein
MSRAAFLRSSVFVLVVAELDFTFARRAERDFDDEPRFLPVLESVFCSLSSGHQGTCVLKKVNVPPSISCSASARFSGASRSK